MVDFSLTSSDLEILAQVKAEGDAGNKYARYYDDHEDETVPMRLPEADDFPPLTDLYAGRGSNDTPFVTLQMLILMERGAAHGIPLEQAHESLGNAALRSAGTKEQKEKWGHMSLSMSITEPGTGSDTKAIVTTARLVGDEWVINGEKIFVTRGSKSDGVVVWATLDKSAGRGGIKSFLVERGTPGFDIVRKERKMGVRTRYTEAYSFQDCRIPRGNLLGGNEEVKKDSAASYKGVLKTFNMTRPAVASAAVGKASGALDFAREALAGEGVEVDWEGGANTRSAAQQKLIETEADIEAARLTVLRASWLADKGEPNNLEASVCKAKGGDISRSAPQAAMELVGATSISHDYLLEKYLRDARVNDIYEGTAEIQRLVIARIILGFSSDELK